MKQNSRSFCFAVTEGNTSVTEGRNPKIRLWSLLFELYRTWNCQRLIICLERVSDELRASEQETTVAERPVLNSRNTWIMWHDHVASLRKVAKKYTFSYYLKKLSLSVSVCMKGLLDLWTNVLIWKRSLNQKVLGILYVTYFGSGDEEELKDT